MSPFVELQLNGHISISQQSPSLQANTLNMADSVHIAEHVIREGVDTCRDAMVRLQFENADLYKIPLTSSWATWIVTEIKRVAKNEITLSTLLKEVIVFLTVCYKRMNYFAFEIYILTKMHLANTHTKLQIRSNYHVTEVFIQLSSPFELYCIFICVVLNYCLLLWSTHIF